MTKFIVETIFYLFMYGLFYWMGYKTGHLDGLIEGNKKTLNLLRQVLGMCKKPD